MNPPGARPVGVGITPPHGTRQWVYFDTEDNSRELMEKQKLNKVLTGEYAEVNQDLTGGLTAPGIGFRKRVTQIGALTDGAAEFHNRGDVLQFLAWLRGLGPVVVWAHNLQYDLGNLFGRALDFLDVTMVDGRLIRGSWRNVEFRDSLNIWPMSLARIGEAFGSKKEAFDAHSKKYVMRDVSILRRAMQFARRLAAEHGVEKFPATLGRLCIELWKAQGGSNWQCEDLRARDAYHGGRVEVFKREVEHPAAWVDVNSLYPWALTHRFPGPLDDVRSDLDGDGLARVTVKIPETWLGPLPFLTDGRLYYPQGRVTGTWTTVELRAAVRTGATVEKLHWCSVARETDPYYRDFITTFYALRQKCKTGAENLFYKLLMNNLSGQLAMTGEVHRSENLTPQNAVLGQVYGSKALVPRQYPLPEHVNWLHAAWLTALGRVRLMDYLARAGEKRVIYCDTDSVILTDKNPFEDSKELGEMKLEAKTKPGEVVMALAPKLYQFGDLAKAKGVPRRLARQFIKTGRVAYDSPFRLREAIAWFDRGNTRQLSVWRQVTKEMASEYDRKKFENNRFTPLTFFGKVADSNLTQ